MSARSDGPPAPAARARPGAAGGRSIRLLGVALAPAILLALSPPSMSTGIHHPTIPSDAGLRGLTFRAQAFVVDPASGRPLAVTLTNGLTVTIQ